MWADCIVVAPPALDHDLSFLQRIEDLSLQQLVAQAGVEALDVAVLQGTAGRDVGRLGATAPIHSRTAVATNSGPLWERMCPGTPRRMNRSDSTSMTSMALSLRATRIARLSCVNSSRTLSMRYFLPSWVRSSTKS